MTNVSCSYTHTNGTNVSLFCTSGSGSPYCCQATDNKYCSTSECSTDSSSSFDTKTVVFWGILGGLLFVSFVTTVTVYIFCYSRNPGKCLSRDPIEELLEVGDETESHGEREHTAKQTAKQTTKQNTQPPNNTDVTISVTVEHLRHDRTTSVKQVQETRRICVTPQSCSSEESYSASLDRVRLVANDRKRKCAGLKPTESSSSPSNSSRTLQVTSIGYS